MAQEELQILDCSVLERIISGDERIIALQDELEALENREMTLRTHEVQRVNSILDEVGVPPKLPSTGSVCIPSGC